jgi:hypothetical protein
VPPKGPAIDVVFKTRWWTLPDTPVAPLGGLPSTLSSKLGGRRCRTCRQCPTGPPPSTSSPTSVVDAAGSTDSAPRGARHRCLVATGSRCQYPLPTPPWEALVDYHHSACYSKSFHEKNFQIFAVLRTRRRETVKKVSSNVTKRKVYLQSKKCQHHRYRRAPYASSGWCSNRSAMTFTACPRPVQPPKFAQQVPASLALGKPGGLGYGGITTRAPQSPSPGCGPLPPASWR